MAFSSKEGPERRGPELLLERIPTQDAKEALKAVLDTARHQVDRDFEADQASIAASDRRGRRYVLLACLGIAAFLAVLLVCILSNKDDLAKLLIPGMVGLGAGAFGGYGFGKASRRDNDD